MTLAQGLIAAILLAAIGMFIWGLRMPIPALPNHRKGSRRPVSSQRSVVTNVIACGRVSVAAMIPTCRAPAVRSSADTSIAAEYHMLRQATSETTDRSRTAWGCAFSSDRMGSEGARYHTW